MSNGVSNPIGRQQMINVALIDPDPDQPRKHFDESDLLSLGQNLRKYGQKVPIFVYPMADRFGLPDGERRWRAASLVGIKELAAIVLDSKPSAMELHLLRMSIDFHKVAHSPIERSDLLHRIKTESGWSITEIAERLGMKQPLVSKLLAFQKLAPDVRELLQRGELDMEKAFALTQEADPIRQSELAKQAGTLSRDQLRNELRKPGQVEAKLTSARLKMPGVDIDLRGAHLDMNCVIGVLSEAIRILKKGQSSGWDLSTQCRVLRDQAKKLPKSANRQPIKGA